MFVLIIRNTLKTEEKLMIFSSRSDFICFLYKSNRGAVDVSYRPLVMYITNNIYMKNLFKTFTKSEICYSKFK